MKQRPQIVNTPEALYPMPEALQLLPDYDAEVSDQSRLREDPVICRYGSIERRTVAMDDGTLYDFNKFIPRVQRSDTAIVELTAWWTHPDLAHYMKSGRAAMRLGYPKIVIGPPIGFRAKDVSLTKAVFDSHRILDTELPTLEVEIDQAIVNGASRGGMGGIGISSPKYSNGRKTAVADVTAACIPRAFKLKEWPGVVSQVIDEARSLIDIGIEYGSRGQLDQYIASLPPKNVSHIANALRIFPGLISGVAGTLYEASDSKTAIRLVEFSKDGWGQVSEWEKLFEDRPNAVVIRKVGTHVGGIACTQTRRDSNARLERLSEIRGYDGSFDNIDFIKDVFPVEADNVSVMGINRVIPLRKAA